MTRLSKEFLEKIAIREKTTFQNTQELIDRELRLLVEEIAARYTK
jgi:hypothetical protein